MTIYGEILQDNANLLSVDTDHSQAVEFVLQGYGSRKPVRLTMLEVDELVGQLIAWLDESSRGDNK